MTNGERERRKGSDGMLKDEDKQYNEIYIKEILRIQEKYIKKFN